MDAAADPGKPQNRFNPHLPQHCELAKIVDEIAGSSFCKRQKLTACAVKGVWEAFCMFICESIKLGKVSTDRQPLPLSHYRPHLRLSHVPPTFSLGLYPYCL
jgi:hypothetical protein